MKGRAGSGGPGGVRRPGGRKSALRPELQAFETARIDARAAGQFERRTDRE